jgi:hypothetical protein
MARAAYNGKVDFSKADVRDRNWWLRLNIMLDQLEAEQINAVLFR